MLVSPSEQVPDCERSSSALGRPVLQDGSGSNM